MGPQLPERPRLVGFGLHSGPGTKVSGLFRFVRLVESPRTLVLLVYS